MPGVCVRLSADWPGLLSAASFAEYSPVCIRASSCCHAPGGVSLAGAIICRQETTLSHRSVFDVISYKECTRSRVAGFGDIPFPPLTDFHLGHERACRFRRTRIGHSNLFTE